MSRPERRRLGAARWRDEALIGLALAALVVAMVLGAWVWRIDRLVYDLGLSLWTRPPPPGIVIVAIDDASIEAIGRWPWRRAIHASLLERLALARPKAVALDLVLSEPDTDPEQDRLLSLALQRAAPVVLPVAWAAQGGSLQGPSATQGEALPWVPLEPAGVLRQGVTLGSAESAVDADGVLRNAFLYSGPPRAMRAHLALAMLEAAGETVSPRVAIERETQVPGSAASSAAAAVPGDASGSGWQRDGRLLIRYAGPPGTVDRVSYVDVLRGEVPAARLAGRHVLVGLTAQGLGDTLATPVNAWHQAMPGVEVLANTLYTLRSGDALREADERWVAAGSALALLLLLASFGRFGPRVALPLALLCPPLMVAASLLAIGAGLWVGPVPLALTAALAYPLWSWRRLERAVVSLDQEIATLDDELQDAPGEARAAGPTRGGDAIDLRMQTLQRAGRLMREARRFLKDAVAALPTAVLVADHQLRVTMANPKAAALYDVESADDLLGLDLPRLLAELQTVPAFDWPGTLARLGVGDEGVAVQGHMAGSGDYVVHLAALDQQGQRSLIVTMADVEPVKQAEREREEALAFVSHDLRSPATSIVMLADLNLRGAEHTPRDELLREVRRLAARTVALSESYVRAAQARSQPLQRSTQEVGALIEDSLVDLRAQARAADVHLRAAGDAGAVSLSVDRLQLVRALANLVSNAIKHSPRGGTVELSALVRRGRLVFSVRDEGPGLLPEQWAQVNEGHEGLAVRDARGVGLGLLFVQRVARRHDGSLHARPGPQGLGAIFEIELPI